MSSVVSDSDASDPGGHVAPADVYFSGNAQRLAKRTYSLSEHRKLATYGGETVPLRRRLSNDEQARKPRKFLMHVEDTMRMILEQEDTDGDFQITITDAGPKVLAVGTASSNGFKSFDIRGTWMLSTLLQELQLAHDAGRHNVIIHEERLTESPVERLSRMIRTLFWNGLTRRIDADGLEAICADPKNSKADQSYRIYVPEDELDQLAYYREVARQRPHLQLNVEVLPKTFDAQYVKGLNDKPGVLALAMKKTIGADGHVELEGLPFIVPGDRFNELYNWDSYFISLGLIIDGRLDMAVCIAEHFVFCIRHYHKVPNGSRSYYLMRSQPPFLTDLALQVYSRWRQDPKRKDREAEDQAWLQKVIKAAIKEYHSYWMSARVRDPLTGLSRYRPDGAGIPPETESTHFTHILKPFAEKHGISVNELTELYNNGQIEEPELDEYFAHDRAVRESGHDTTYRFEKRCANLATIDLNTLLFKYEVDIAHCIQLLGEPIQLEEDFELTSFPFGDTSLVPWPPAGSDKSMNFSFAAERSASRPQTQREWLYRATRRRQLIDKFLWDQGKGLYFDYDCKEGKRISYETVTAFWAMWAGCASTEQAAKLVSRGLPKFEVAGGLVPGTEESRGKISLDRPNRQWDYPSAWSPHQMLAWLALDRYGYREECQRLAYRWAWMLTTAFVDHNGVVPEKFDAVALSHKVSAEYGNQGIDFRCVPKQGFGWTNASYVMALTFLTVAQRRALGNLVSPEAVFKVLPGTGEHDFAAP